MDFKNRPRPTIITEYMTNGSVGDLLKNKPKFPMVKRYILLLGIALGMKFLHSKSIIHRDLKPDNIVLDENYQPHICDFGESKVSDELVSQIVMDTPYGSPLYMAPEILQFEPYTYKLDVYSFSIVAYEIITNKKPFPSIKSKCQLKKAVVCMKRPDLSIINNEDLQELLSRC